MDEDLRRAAGDEEGVNIPNDPCMFDASIPNDPGLFDTPITTDPRVFDVPLAIDPRLLNMTPSQQPNTTFSPTSNVLQPGYQSPSRYVVAGADLSLPETFPEQTLTASSNRMPVSANTSSLSDVPTRRDASQEYKALSPSSRSLPPPFRVPSARYAPITDEYSPYYSLPSSSDQLAMPFDTSFPSSALPQQEYVTQPEYVTPGEYVSLYPPLTPEEHASPYHCFPRSSYPRSMPSDASLPKSASASKYYASSYPPLTTEEQSSPYHSFTTSSYPMPKPANTAVPSSAFTSEEHVSPEEYRSPKAPRRRKLLTMPKPVRTPSSSLSLPPRDRSQVHQSRLSDSSLMPMSLTTSVPSFGLTSEDFVSPEDYWPPRATRRRRLLSTPKPVETLSSSTALMSEDHRSPNEYTSPYAPRRRNFKSKRKPIETPSPSLSLPPCDAPKVNESSPPSSRLIFMPADTPSSYAPQSAYGPQPSYGNPPSHGARPGYGAYPSNVYTPNDGYGASSGYKYYLRYEGEPSNGPPASGGPPGSQAIPIAWSENGVRQWPRDPDLVVFGSRIYTDACGVVTPSNVPPGKKPAKAGLNRANDTLQCPICESRFNRYRSVTTHFKSCAKKNGNPEGKFWLDHPSLSLWRGPRLDKSLYMTDRPAYNALKDQGPSE